ncbi:MAG: hypothetical protein AAF264_08475, partial [Pseudomonadota bacterium]
PLIKVDATSKRIKSAIAATVKALDLPFGDGVTVRSGAGVRAAQGRDLRARLRHGGGGQGGCDG